MNLALPTTADPVEARALWHPARLTRGDVVLATVAYDDVNAVWIARIPVNGRGYSALYEEFDTFAEAVAWVDGWLKKKGLR